MYNLRNRSFLKETDFTTGEMEHLLRALARRSSTPSTPGTEVPRLGGKEIALIFEKTSTRTRAAFEVAAFDQGAHVTYLDPSGSQMGHKESVADTARVLGRMFDAIEFRGSAHEAVEELARHAGVPVYNGLTDEWHPTQMLADFLTMQEASGKRSRADLLLLHGRRAQQHGPLAAGHGGDHGQRRADLRAARAAAARGRAARSPASAPPRRARRPRSPTIATRPSPGADFVHTDVWVSMGEAEGGLGRAGRAAAALPGQRGRARGDRQPAGPLHALPARLPRREYRRSARKIIEATGMTEGLEVTDEVFESPASIVFDQAENRLHTIKAVLVATIGG